MGGDKWWQRFRPIPVPGHRTALSAPASVWPHCRARCRGRGATMGVPLEPGGAALAKKGGEGGGIGHPVAPAVSPPGVGMGRGTGAQRGPQPGLCCHPSSKPPCTHSRPIPKATVPPKPFVLKATVPPKPPPVPIAISRPPKATT